MAPGARRRYREKLKLEDILAEELRREMHISTAPRFSEDWETALYPVEGLPIDYGQFTKKVAEMTMLREVVDALSTASFINVKRSESRRKQLREFTKTMSMYYNLIFAYADSTVGYGAMIHFPELARAPERSSGVVLMAKITLRSGKTESTFERSRFSDFLLDVKPYIEMLGNLYRQTRRI